jgi:catechol 2,3-dioxygenase-like lactoylglutathione lyase family enzyme
MRGDREFPPAVVEWGWKFHHFGIPTSAPVPGEYAVPHLGIHVAGFETSPYGAQWMRFDPGSSMPEIIRTVPHVAFVVPDLQEALKGKTLLGGPNSPSPGLTVAMIVHDGVPIELMEFENPGKENR